MDKETSILGGSINVDDGRLVVAGLSIQADSGDEVAIWLPRYPLDPYVVMVKSEQSTDVYELT